MSLLMGKTAEKAVCKSAFLMTCHCILSAELTKNAHLQTVFFGDFAHLGWHKKNIYIYIKSYVSSFVVGEG